MLLHTFFDSVEIHRADKVVFARFLRPFRVGATSRPRGGLLEDLDTLLNHQGCEPSGHQSPLTQLALKDPDEYHRKFCEFHGFDPARTESLGTAANMNHLGVSKQSFRDLEVAACVTAGVETNAGRAGDHANYFEHDGCFERISDDSETFHESKGTIVTMVFINRELTPNATIRAVMMGTEAKTSVLQELMVPSRYSTGLATGTGTDQIAVASPIGDIKPLTSAGKHMKLGELIARAVREATFEALERQNGLTPSRQCSVSTQLARFGTNKTSFYKDLEKELPDDLGALLARNIGSVDTDAPTVAAVAALTHLADQLDWGILNPECLPEILTFGSAGVAAAVAGNRRNLAKYHELLSVTSTEFGARGVLQLCIQAIALGYRDRWSHLDEMASS